MLIISHLLKYCRKPLHSLNRVIIQLLICIQLLIFRSTVFHHQLRKHQTHTTEIIFLLVSTVIIVFRFAEVDRIFHQVPELVELVRINTIVSIHAASNHHVLAILGQKTKHFYFHNIVLVHLIIPIVFEIFFHQYKEAPHQLFKQLKYKPILIFINKFHYFVVYTSRTHQQHLMVQIKNTVNMHFWVYLYFFPDHILYQYPFFITRQSIRPL